MKPFAALSGANPRLLAQVRRAAILSTLRRTGSVSVSPIATHLGVSEMTIRRDLVDLERDGHLTRTHGGAIVPRSQAVAMDADEPPFDTRLHRQRLAKGAVAAEAARLIGDARTLALDVGATTFLLAELLRGRPGPTLFTNSLRIATALAESPFEVHVPGGRVKGTEQAVGGPTALATFEKLWFDVAVLGVSGITADGLFDYSFDDTEMKRIYLRRSTRKIVLCDASKFRRMSLVRVAGFEGIDTLVTDAPPPDEIAQALQTAGVAVRLAGTA